MNYQAAKGAHQVDGAVAGAAANALQLQPRLHHVQWSGERCSHTPRSAACSGARILACQNDLQGPGKSLLLSNTERLQSSQQQHI